MPPQTLIAGAEGTITINGDPMVTGQASNFQLTQNVMEKSFIGQAWGHSLKGQKRASFTASGSVSTQNVEELYDAWTTGLVVISIQLGTAAGATDGGLFSGSFNVSNLTFQVSGDGEWDFSFDAVSDGTITNTPAGS